MPEARLVARHESRAPTTDLRDSARRLPEELLLEQVQRLALFAVVIGCLWGLGLFVHLVLLPLAWSMPMSNSSIALDAAGILLAAAMVWYVKYCRWHTPTQK